jgi:hypothetical protein
MAMLALPACERPRITRATPEASQPPTASPTLATSVLPTFPTEPVDTNTYSIERIAMATRVNDLDEPLPEVGVVPEAARQFYLCVKAEGLPPGARFRAYWLENGQIIGQSDKVSIETEGRPTWVALEYHPPFPLNPAFNHAVELLIDDVKIDRYVFRVGSGDPADAIAEAAFASRFDEAGEPVGVKTRFPMNTTALTLRVRISSKVDPSGMTLATLWFRGDTQVAERPVDPLPEATATQTAASERQFSFTWTPGTLLTPGSYHATILMNGAEAKVVPFVVLDANGIAPAATPGATAPARGTGTASPATTASIKTVMVTETIDEDSSEPIDGRISEWDAAAGSTVELWIAVHAINLKASDRLDVLVSVDGDLFASDQIPTKNLTNGWVALPVRFQVPTLDDGATDYNVNILLNGANAASTDFTMTPVEE